MALSRWTMLLCVIALASGCATVPGNYCAVAQKPFEWRSDAEIDATPIRPLRYMQKARRCIGGSVLERNKAREEWRLEDRYRR